MNFSSRKNTKGWLCCFLLVVMQQQHINGFLTPYQRGVRQNQKPFVLNREIGGSQFFAHNIDVLHSIDDSKDLIREQKQQQQQHDDNIEQLEKSFSISELSDRTDEAHIAEDALLITKVVSEDSTLATDEKFSFLSGMSDVLKARILLLVAAALYGTNFSFVKILGETDLSVGLSATLRFGLAVVATIPWLLQVDQAGEEKGSVDLITRFKILTDPSREEWQSAMAGLEVGVWVAMGYIFQAIGLETTDASKSAFLCSLAVVIVPLLDILAGKKMLPRQIIGALLAVVGVGFLELGGAGAGSLSSLSFGDLCSLVQPLAFGMGFWRMENAMHKFPEQANRTTAGQLLSVFLASTAYLAYTTTGGDASAVIPPISDLQTMLTDPMILFALFWTGMITTALTVYLETVALKTLSAAETTIIFSTEPLWGTACAALLMGERLGMDTALGAVLILSGCLFSNLGLNGILSFLPGRGDRADKIMAETNDTMLFDNKQDNLKDSVEPASYGFPGGSALPQANIGFAGLFSGLTAGLQKGINPAFADDATIAKVANTGIVELDEFVIQMSKSITPDMLG